MGDKIQYGAADLARMVEETLPHLVRFLEQMPKRPVSDFRDLESYVATLDSDFPHQRRSFTACLDEIFHHRLEKGLNATHPGFYGYIPTGAIFPPAVADLIANVVNRYTGVWEVGAGFTQFEIDVIRWFNEIVGFPETAGGFLTTGASLATFSAVVTAREKILGEAFLDGVVYTSDQAHHSVQKAARLAGFPSAQIRAVPCDARFRMDVEQLTAMIRADRDQGLRPCLVVATAGTTNTGAVDPLGKIADLCREYKLWLHVDAAYGGFFRLTDFGKALLAGLERADSVCLDPHKGLFLPYGTGALLVKDPRALREAHGHDASYLPKNSSSLSWADFSKVSPELTRDARGLRVWLSLKLYGIEVFRNLIQEKRDLAVWLGDRVREIPGMRIVAEPELSLFAFQFQGNRETRWLVDELNATGKVYLSGTTVGDQYLARVCVLCFRTERPHVEELLDLIQGLASSRKS